MNVPTWKFGIATVAAVGHMFMSNGDATSVATVLVAPNQQYYPVSSSSTTVYCAIIFRSNEIYTEAYTQTTSILFNY